jgi:hypothetical protein
MLCRTVAAIANDPDFHLSLKLQPGDIEIIHNPSTFHSRTKVVDGEVGHCFEAAAGCCTSAAWVEMHWQKQPVTTSSGTVVANLCHIKIAAGRLKHSIHHKHLTQCGAHWPRHTGTALHACHMHTGRPVGEHVYMCPSATHEALHGL